ncbi:hypothetical protein CAL7102_07065 [Dulcicalothrix desertica PCC 7102]|nr:hypothetical protein CAL7102_07065 [Dulcicalothrix desertica PCC 7102]
MYLFYRRIACTVAIFLELDYVFSGKKRLICQGLLTHTSNYTWLLI